MGYLSSLLQKYTSEEVSATTSPVTKPEAQPIPVQAQSPAQQEQSSSSSSSSSLSQNASVPLSADAELREKMRNNPRARKVRQLSLFFAGATFFTLSALVTRRAIARKLLATAPKQFTPSNFQPKDANGAVEAAEAFGLATLNVTSAAMMVTGGAMYALDITDMDDMRRKFKMRMGFNRIDISDGDADEEIEEWVKGLLDKKEGGDSKSIAEGLTALVGVLAGKEEEKMDKLNELMKKDSDNDKK